MAEKVDIIDIDLSKLKKEVKETEKTVKDLKDDLSDLKKTTESTGKAATNAAKDLKVLQGQNKQLENSTKGLSSSQNRAASSILNTDKSIASADKSLGEFNKELKSTANQSKETGKAIDGLSSNIDNLANSTTEYETVQLDSLEIMENTTLIAAGFTGAIQAVEGAINLMGIESEEVTETIAKMQSIMAITDGLRAIAEGVKAYKTLNAAIKSSAAAQKIMTALTIKDVTATTAATAAKGGYTLATKLATMATRTFNKVLKSNPLILIVTAITSAVVAISELTDAWSDASAKEEEAREKAKAAAEEWKQTFKDFKDNITDLNKRMGEARMPSTIFDSDILRAQGASTLEILKQQYKEYHELMKRAVAARDKFIKENSEYLKMRDGKLITKGQVPKEILDEYSRLTEEIVRYREARKDTYKAIALEQIRLAQEAADKEVEIANQRKKDREKLLKEIEDDETKLARLQEIRDVETYDKYAADRSRDIEDAAAYYRERLIIYKQAETDGLITEEEYKSIKLKMEREFGLQREAIITEYDKKLSDDMAAARQARIDALAAEFEQMRAMTNQFYQNRMNEESIAGNHVGSAQLGQEMMNDIIYQYETQISLFDKMGLSTEDLKLQLDDAKNALAQFVTDETLAKLDETRALLQGASDSFQELNAIGNGVSDQWGAVFDSMTAGLDRVQHAVEKGGKGWSKYGAMASAGLHVASSMLMAIADEQNESTEEGFEKQKKLQIAAASMAMMGGIIDAWTSAMNPANAWMTIWGQVAAGAATSAMILATGIMQINAIKRQKMDGSGGEGGAVANPALSALTNLGSGVSATTEIEGASTEGKVQDTRVYVVESDITSSQNNVKTSVDEATY